MQREFASLMDRPAKLNEIESYGDKGLRNDGYYGRFKNSPEMVIRYEDGNHYQRIFLPLIKQEAETERMLKESQSYDNVSVCWGTGPPFNKRQIARFTLPHVEARIVPGDDLRLIFSLRDWDASGIVLKIPDDFNDEYSLQLRQGTKNVPLDLNHNFQVKCVWKSVSFDRMCNALTTFATNAKCMSPYIYNTLLGYPIWKMNTNRVVELPKRITAPYLPELNDAQVSAVKMAIGSQISLIQGPPGTGKTVTSATLVHHLVTKTRAKMLVCAPSNAAVDQLTEKIHEAGLKVVRVYSKSQEMIQSRDPFLSLRFQILSNPEMKKLHLLKKQARELPKDDERRYRSLREQVEQELLNGADVVCTTCVGAGDPKIGKIRFEVVLIDDSTQAIEPECLIPIILGCKQLILVGDQPGEVAAVDHGLSMFERLVALGLPVHRLQVQYRMHPILSAFSSSIFYEGSILNGVSPVNRDLTNLRFLWPNPEKPMFFLNTCGSDELVGSGKSLLNRTDTQLVEKLTTTLLNSGLHPSQIGIITPYEGQRSFDINYIPSGASFSIKAYQAIQMGSVEAFLGQEKDIIILSCFRSKQHHGTSFLKDPRLLNVALTRAKYGMIIVGNARILATQPLWNHLLHHFANSGLLVDGPISRLHPSTVELPSLKRLHIPALGAEDLRSLQHHLAQIDSKGLKIPIPKEGVLKPDVTYRCGSCGECTAVIEPDGSCPNCYEHDIKMSPLEVPCSPQRLPEDNRKQVVVNNKQLQSAASKRQVRDATVQTNAPQTTMESLSGTRCLVCYDKQICVLLRPCKHISLCEGCVKLIKTCPICKSPVTTFETVFLAGMV